MAYKVGETVVYPHHGAADIISKEKRTIKGEEREYLVLRVHQSDLTVRVPSDNLDLVGVRDVTSQAGLEKVFGVLRMPYVEDPANWSRRFKANTEKLSSGDVIKVAKLCVTYGVAHKRSHFQLAKRACLLALALS
jgi:CarD family transcriptional regulator